MLAPGQVAVEIHETYIQNPKNLHMQHAAMRHWTKGETRYGSCVQPNLLFEVGCICSTLCASVSSSLILDEMGQVTVPRLPKTVLQDPWVGWRGLGGQVPERDPRLGWVGATALCGFSEPSGAGAVTHIALDVRSSPLNHRVFIQLLKLVTYGSAEGKHFASTTAAWHTEFWGSHPHWLLQ